MPGYRQKKYPLFSAFENKTIKLVLALIACSMLCCASAEAQRPRFDDFFSSQSSGGLPVPAQTIPALPTLPGNLNSIITTPPAQLNPPVGSLPTLPQGILNNRQIFDGGPFNGGQIIPGGVVPNPNVGSGLALPGFTEVSPGLGTGSITAPSFDPFRAGNQAFPIFPRVTQPAIQPVIPQPNLQPVPRPQAQFNQPALPQFNPGQFNSGQFQVFPQRQLPAIDFSGVQQAWGRFRSDYLPRVLERPQIRRTYLHGNNGNELDINDIEISTTANRPNFLGGSQPLRISPGFGVHLWNGPVTEDTGFDLPPIAYSPSLSFDHITDPRRASGIEGRFTVGFYSDFDNTSSDAIRLTGKFLGWRRVNPYTVAKLGIEYLDRVDVKILPAVGLYLTPNPDLKLDLYFPKSKLSHRLPNFRNLEAWGYVGAEYGGGSWAIERADGSNDQVDINDVRAYLGVEWITPRRNIGYLEFGYAFNRELVFRSDALDQLQLEDTLLISTGIAF